MNAKERAIVVKCLRAASDRFSCHGCNDTPSEWWADWTPEELAEFDKQENDWNGTPEDHDPSQPTAHHYDWLVMSFLAAKIEAENGETTDES